MKIFIILILSLLLLLLLPIRVRLRYGKEGFSVRLFVIGIPFSLYPAGRRVKRKKKSAPRQSARKKSEAPIEKKTKGLKDYIRLLKLVYRVLSRIQRRFRRSFSVRVKRIYVSVGTGDAASTAIAYGAISQCVSYVLSVADGFLKTRYDKNSVCVIPNYLQERYDFSLHIALCTNPLRLITLGLLTLFAMLGARQKQDNKPTGE